jgi:two-component system alkaline phosphatase synthesis response regulator PhoP
MNYAAASDRKKILLVDDNEIILQAVAAKLERAGHQIFVALDGGEAADITLRENLDLIVVDANFAPDVYGLAWDGFQIIERLWDLNFTRNVPIVAISSLEDEQEREHALKCGVAAFFRKPFGHPDLVRVIQETLQSVPAA